MCTTCGCNQPADAITMKLIGSDTPVVAIPQRPDHTDHPGHQQQTTTRADQQLLQLEIDILAQNDHLAGHNRDFFARKNITAFNLVSSPGSGKTSLLEQSLRSLQERAPCAVIEGDQQTSNDADRIAATGAPVVQINTGKGCHLDADMIHKALPQLDLPDNSLLFIENVGNLVCPALFDLGESHRVVIISVTEGDDKPLKYPDMFHTADICVINKVDLLPYVPFDVDQVEVNARKINPSLQFFPPFGLYGGRYGCLAQLHYPTSAGCRNDG